MKKSLAVLFASYEQIGMGAGMVKNHRAFLFLNAVNEYPGRLSTAQNALIMTDLFRNELVRSSRVDIVDRRNNP